MSTQSEKRERHDLIAEIVRAFDGIDRGDGITLHQAVAIDDYKTAQEQWDARRFDTERRWQDVPAAALVECQTALSFLDEDGFRYYLPAFMVRGLEDWDNAAGVPLDSCVYHLLHDYPNSLRKSEPAAIAAKYRFNAAQCCAIARFLRLVVGPDNECTVEHTTTHEAVAKWELLANQCISAT